MPKQWCALLLGLFALLLTSVTSFKSSSSPRELFTSSFLVRFKRSIDNPLAHEIAKRNGFHNIGEVMTIAMLIIHHRAYLIYCHFLHSTINPCILHYRECRNAAWACLRNSLNLNFMKACKLILDTLSW